MISPWLFQDSRCLNEYHSLSCLWMGWFSPAKNESQKNSLPGKLCHFVLDNWGAESLPVLGQSLGCFFYFPQKGLFTEFLHVACRLVREHHSVFFHSLCFIVFKKNKAKILIQYHLMPPSKFERKGIKKVDQHLDA